MVTNREIEIGLAIIEREIAILREYSEWSRDKEATLGQREQGDNMVIHRLDVVTEALERTRERLRRKEQQEVNSFKREPDKNQPS